MRAQEKYTRTLCLRCLYMESVKCGFPSPADGYQEQLELDEYLIRNPNATADYSMIFIVMQTSQMVVFGGTYIMFSPTTQNQVIARCALCISVDKNGIAVFQIDGQYEKSIADKAMDYLLRKKLLLNLKWDDRKDERRVLYRIHCCS